MFPKQNSSSFSSLKRAQILFLFILVISIFLNISIYKEEFKRIQAAQEFMPTQPVGYQFAGLDQFTQGIPRIGYFTDQNINDPQTSKLFAQAQYVLAPTILDLNARDAEYTLFVCSREEIALQKIQEMNVEPLRRNKFGMILAKKK